MNPYEPTLELRVNPTPKVHYQRNPAKRYLLFSSILCVLGLLVTFPVGPARIFVQQTASCLTFILFLTTSLLLALSTFGSLNRAFTVIWAILAALAIMFVITYVDPTDLPPKSRDLPGMGIVLGILAFLANIVRLAVLAKPTQSEKAACQLLNERT